MRKEKKWGEDDEEPEAPTEPVPPEPLPDEQPPTVPPRQPPKTPPPEEPTPDRPLPVQPPRPDKQPHESKKEKGKIVRHD